MLDKGFCLHKRSFFCSKTDGKQNKPHDITKKETILKFYTGTLQNLLSHHNSSKAPKNNKTQLKPISP